MLDRVSMAGTAAPALPAPRPPSDSDTAPRTRPAAPGPGGVPPRGGRRAVWAAVLTAGLWAALTGPEHWGDPATWVFGAAAVVAVAAVVRAMPAQARRMARLSPVGALRLAGWFCVQAVRGAVDVARRAFSPALPVAPGWYRHPLGLPPGAPRLVMANVITMLPGTLTAELHEDGATDSPDAPSGVLPGQAYLVIHLLDARIDPAPELAALEARVRAAFVLSAPLSTPGAEARP